MTLDDALSLVDAAQSPLPRSTWSPPNKPAGAPYPYRSWRKTACKPEPKPEPVTVAEIHAQKAADLERRKKATARQEREDLKLYAEQDKANAIVREQQAARDREWAEARAQQQ